jgi:hypothetical protein
VNGAFWHANGNNQVVMFDSEAGGHVGYWWLDEWGEASCVLAAGVGVVSAAGHCSLVSSAGRDSGSRLMVTWAG